MAKSNKGSNFFTEKFTPKPKPVRITNKQFNKLPQLADLKREEEERRNNVQLTGWNTAIKKPSKFSQDAQYEKPAGRRAIKEVAEASKKNQTDKRGFEKRSDDKFGDKRGPKPTKEKGFGNKKSYNAKDLAESRKRNASEEGGRGFTSREDRPRFEKTDTRKPKTNNEERGSFASRKIDADSRKSRFDKPDSRDRKSSYGGDEKRTYAPRNSEGGERTSRFDKSDSRDSRDRKSSYGGDEKRTYTPRNSEGGERTSRFEKSDNRDSRDRKSSYGGDEKRTYTPRTSEGGERTSRFDKSDSRDSRDRNSSYGGDEKRTYTPRTSEGGERTSRFDKSDSPDSRDRKSSYGGDEKRTYTPRNSEGGERTSRFDKLDNRDSRDRKSSYGGDEKRTYTPRNSEGGERTSRFEKSDSRESRDRKSSYGGDEKRTYTPRNSEGGERPTRAPRSDNEYSNASEPSMPLNKFVAKCGIASRRETVEIIKDGRIKVNGKLVTEPAFKVIESDKVRLDDKPLQYQGSLVYLLLNKPKDFITTVSDEKGRKTVMQLVASACEERIYPVGRLDRNTSGLLLLTNDGELTQKMSHPKYAIKKLYQVNLDKPLTKEDFDAVVSGIELEDGITEVDELSYIDPKDKSIVGIQIHSGKNRIVRRIFEHLGYEVKQLDRVMYANLTKKNLPRGNWRFLTETEVRFLKYFNSKVK